MSELASFRMGTALAVILIFFGSGCSSISKTTASYTGDNTSHINKQQTAKPSAEMPVKFGLLAVNKTKDKQPFQYYLNGPIESRAPKDGQSFLIVDFEFNNPNSSASGVHFGEKDFALLTNGALISSNPYVWSGANQIQIDARDMSRIMKTASGYWHEHLGGGSTLSSNETRNMRIMFEIPDNYGEEIVILIKGMKYSFK